MKKTYVSDSCIDGKGLFAAENIQKGETIALLTGEEVSLEEILKRIERGDEALDDPLQIGEERFLDLDDRSRQINHSCEPNAGIRGKCELVATRSIQRGEEVTFDYSTTVGKTSHWWSMQCRCGAPSCRSRIGNISTLPEERIALYRKLNVLPDYIRKQLAGDV